MPTYGQSMTVTNIQYVIVWVYCSMRCPVVSGHYHKAKFIPSPVAIIFQPEFNTVLRSRVINLGRTLYNEIQTKSVVNCCFSASSGNSWMLWVRSKINQSVTFQAA